MSQIEWDQSFSMGNAEIDAQHKKWIDIYNKLDAIMEEGNPQAIKRATIDTLEAMLDYARYHFQFEEKYMHGIDYPGIAAHARVHKDFDHLIYKSYRDALDGAFVLNTRLLKTIKSWLINHILIEDKKYSQFAGKDMTELTPPAK